MPYEVVRVGERGAKQFEVMNLASGRGHGRTTHAKAVRQERLLRAVEHGFKPRRK